MFAEVLAECGELAARLVELHVDDGSGYCGVCWSGDQTVRQTFPCNIRSAATAALRSQASALAGTVLPKSHAGPAV